MGDTRFTVWAVYQSEKYGVVKTSARLNPSVPGCVETRHTAYGPGVQILAPGQWFRTPYEAYAKVLPELKGQLDRSRTDYENAQVRFNEALAQYRDEVAGYKPLEYGDGLAGLAREVGDAEA